MRWSPKESSSAPCKRWLRESSSLGALLRLSAPSCEIRATRDAIRLFHAASIFAIDAHSRPPLSTAQSAASTGISSTQRGQKIGPAIAVPFNPRRSSIVPTVALLGFEVPTGDALIHLHQDVEQTRARGFIQNSGG